MSLRILPRDYVPFCALSRVVTSPFHSIGNCNSGTLFISFILCVSRSQAEMRLIKTAHLQTSKINSRNRPEMVYVPPPLIDILGINVKNRNGNDLFWENLIINISWAVLIGECAVTLLLNSFLRRMRAGRAPQ